MTTVTNLRRTLGLLCLGLLLIPALGCNKMLAQYNVKSAQKRVEEAKGKNGEVLTKTELNDTQQAINKTVNEINMQNFKEAVASSKLASSQAKSLLARVTELRARELRDEANKWLKIGNVNMAQQIDPQHFPQYIQDNEKGLKYLEKESYDKAIKVFASVVDNVNAVLKTLADESKAGVTEAKTMKDELIKEGAPKYAPKYIEDMDKFIAQISDLTDAQKNYREALRILLLARQSKQEGIDRTKEEKSKEILNEIENLLGVATDLNAGTYALQNYKACGKEYNDLLQKFFERNYLTVLVAAPNLKPKVQDLIVETKRNAADAMAKEVENSINDLVDGKARTYLPGKVEQVEALLSQARQLFGEKAEKGYEESKKVSERGMELYQNILQEFNGLAEVEIKKASDVLATGENVYRTMQDIFDKKLTGAVNPADQKLEDAKQAMKEELRVQLQNARLSLELASLKRQEKDFDLAIETAKAVAQSADNVHQQTYRVVAHNAILEIANELSTLEREGGRQYAAAETDKTLKLLEVSKGMLHGGQFRDAVKGAADSKAQLEILKQDLGRVAVARIDDASRALQAAKASRAEQYENGTFNQSIVSLDRSKVALEGKGLQQAIELANQARQQAEAATEKSLKQWATEEIRRTDILLGKARTAGAEHYAAERMQKALDIRQTLQALYDQGSYQQAIQVGEQAVEAADAAFYAKVIEAESEIATAKRYDGWQQEHRRMTEAEVSARNAREAMDAGKYDLGLQHSQAAIVHAKEIAKDSKRKSFETRMASLSKHMETAQREGAGYYQSKDLAKILTDMNRLRNDFDATSYEDLSNGVEKLESQLAGVMEMTPDVLKGLVESMQNRMAELENRRAKSLMPGEVAEVEQKVKFAQIDFQAEKYRSSFQNARDASRQMDAIALNLDEREFDSAMNNHLNNFSRQIERFSAVLSMGSPGLIRLATGYQGRTKAVALMNACSPSDLRTQFNEIAVRVRDLPTPPSRKDVRDGAFKMLELAKTAAANFERMLIMDQYSVEDAREIIETGFLQMHQARTQQQDIQRALRYPQADTQPRGVERVLTYHGD